MIKAGRKTPDQLINLWVHLYDLNTIYGHFGGKILAHDPLNNLEHYFEERRRNWRDLEVKDPFAEA